MKSVLQFSLDKVRALHPQNGPGMCNHSYMALIALYELGASEQTLKQRLEEVRGEPWSGMLALGRDWKASLGSRPHALSYRRFFAAELTRLGSRTALLREFLPGLIPGLTKGLLHPAIRLCFALLSNPGDERDSHGDAVDALTYWAIRYEELYEGAAAERKSWSAPKGSLRPAEVFANLGQHRAPAGETFATVAALAADPAFRNLVRSRYGLSSANAVEFLYELSALAVRLYLRKPALTTLHAVTGAQALTDLVPYLGADDQAALVGIFSIWLCALYAEKGFPDLSAYVSVPSTVNWQELSERATSCDDTHTIKLVLSLKSLDAARPDPANLYAADAVVNRNKPW
jgi:hypothetical protein